MADSYESWDHFLRTSFLEGATTEQAATVLQIWLDLQPELARGLRLPALRIIEDSSSYGERDVRQFSWSTETDCFEVVVFASGLVEWFRSFRGEESAGNEDPEPYTKETILDALTRTRFPRFVDM